MFFSYFVVGFEKPSLRVDYNASIVRIPLQYWQQAPICYMTWWLQIIFASYLEEHC
jgi:hypothetical protein